MPPLKKLLFALAVLAATAVGSADVARAQSTALEALMNFTNAQPPGQAQTATQSSTAPFQFGYNNSNGVPPQPFTLYNRSDRPDETGDGGGRLYASQAGATIPSVSFTNTSAAGGVAPGTNPDLPPGPYLIVRPGGSVPQGSGNAPTESVVRYYATTTGQVDFIGFYQSNIGNGAINTFLNGAALALGPNSAILANAAETNFSFSLNLTAGDTVDFVFGVALVDIGNSFRFNVQAIPEPATMLLLGISGLGVAAAAIRRRRKVEEDAAESDDTLVA